MNTLTIIIPYRSYDAGKMLDTESGLMTWEWHTYNENEHFELTKQLVNNIAMLQS
jgi:hypothetical protein